MGVYVRLAELSEKQGENPEWMKFIWKCNEIQNGTFGKPTKIEPWWAGGEVEEYRNARVIFAGDFTVRIASKNERGAKVIIDAANEMGFVVGVA